MSALQALALTLVGAGAAAVVLVRRPARQVVVFGTYGVILTVLFLVVQQPDVALSQLTVGAVVLPAIVLLALRKVSGERGR